MKSQVLTRITSKGQMTLPKAARDELGLKPGDKVAVVIDDHEVRVERPTTLGDIWKLTKTHQTWPGDEAADDVIAQSIADEHNPSR